MEKEFKLLHCVTKSKAAFLMSAQKLFRNQHEGIFFWTFTFREVLSDFQAMMYWNAFMRALLNKYGGMIQGLRVVEVHPGEWSHGLHFHCLLNRRLNINVVRRIAKPHMFGRIGVVKCDSNTGFYLSKYITKDSPLTEGMRKWGTIGGFQAVKVNQIEVNSQLSRNIRWCQNKLEMKQMSYAFFLHVSNQTRRFGLIREWPVEKVNTLTIRNAKAKQMKDIALQDVGLQPPDDDGITYYNLHPLETRFSRLKFVRCRTSEGWTDVAIPTKYNPEREPF